MDLKSITATTTSVAENASKSGLRFVYQWVALHPRTGTVIGLALILASGFVGFAIGVGA